MELSEKLSKLAGGVTVSSAVDAFIRSNEEARASVVDLAEYKRNEEHAIVEVMFLIAAVDGEVSNLELNQLRASLEALSHMDVITRFDFDFSLKQMLSWLERDGWTARLRAACSNLQTPELREFTFRMAVGVAFVDNHVAHAEAAGIEMLAIELGIAKSHREFILRDVQELLMTYG